jgi:hypothetical protein
LYKFGVTDAGFKRMNAEIAKMGTNFGKAKHSGVMPKNTAHLMEKYLRSLQYSSTGLWDLPGRGMKVPHPHNLDTGKKLRKP